MRRLKGLGVSGGSVMGPLRKMDHPVFARKHRQIPPEEQEQEYRRLLGAMESCAAQLEEIRERPEEEAAREILGAHIEITRDPALLSRIREIIAEEEVDAEDALYVASEEFALALETMEDSYLRERAEDVRDVARRVYRILINAPDVQLTEPAVVASEDMTPSLLASLDRRNVLGILSGTGGRTSHVAILAGGMGIPAVLGLGDFLEEAEEGDPVIVNGQSGEAILSPDEERIREYERQREALAREEADRLQYKHKEARTKEGEGRVILHANVNFPEEGAWVKDSGAEGIGLYRTEFLFLNRDSWPGEEEQFLAYKSICTQAAPLPVTIRTMDIGGDKELAYMGLQKEDNPFLGYRALRLSLGRPAMFRRQLRALLRASAFGKLRIMFPMVSHPKEFREAKAHLLHCMEELREEGIPFDEDISLGSMVETPAAALLAEELALEADFLSIGTNDLIQYTMAVDRLNSRVADLYDCYHPAVLRLIRMTVEGAHRQGKTVAVCGEMAAYEEASKLLLGMGVDELSMSSGEILKIKKNIASFTLQEARNLTEKCLSAAGVEEVRGWIKRLKNSERMMSSRKLSFIHADFADPEELIRRVGETAYRLGYVTEDFAEDVVRREEEFPTGLMGALPIAIPHVGSHCNESFMSLTTLKEPLDFRYMDGSEGTLPVRVVFVFGLVDHKDQVKVLQRLAGLFRDREGLECLLAATTAEEACGLLQDYLGELIEMAE